MGTGLRIRKYNILFSVPVHEKPEVILDQINNFFHFNLDCCIVLHISRDFCFDSDYISEERFLDVLNNMDSVYVNPNRLRSGLEDIIQCHISNFRYAYENVDFEYVVFASSNELFFRAGLWDDIKQYDCGPKNRVLLNGETDWIQGKHILRDKEFIEALRTFGILKIYSGQFEGSFMKKDMMLDICGKIESFYDYRTMTLKYAREETFFHTFIAALYPEAHIREDNTTYMNWGNDLKIYVSDVMNLVRDNAGKYSVKRIPRRINDEVRAFIRQYIGRYGEENDKYFHNDNIISGDTALVELNKKNELRSNVFRMWLLNSKRGITICDCLKNNAWHTVSIYGFGEIGKMLFSELKENGAVQVEYIIDKRNTDDTGEIRMVEPYPDLEKTELIIVTVLNDKTLMDQLKSRYTVPCMDIFELLDKVGMQ